MYKGIYDYVEITDIKDLLGKSEAKYGDKPAFKFKTNVPGEFRTTSYKEFADDVNNLGTALIALGLKDKRIAVISENRYEWCVGYMAVVCGTGLVVPMDRALPENEIRSMIERSDVEAIIYSKKYNEIMDRVKEDKISKIKCYISMESEVDSDKVLSMKELIEKGKVLR